jgi:hypothetical protein
MAQTEHLVLLEHQVQAVLLVWMVHSLEVAEHLVLLEQAELPVQLVHRELLELLV